MNRVTLPPPSPAIALFFFYVVLVFDMIFFIVFCPFIRFRFTRSNDPSGGERDIELGIPDEFRFERRAVVAVGRVCRFKDLLQEVIGDDKDNKSVQDCCAVCLEEYGADDEVTSLERCDHVFHTRCVNQWLRTGYYCPMCRGSVSVCVQN